MAKLTQILKKVVRPLVMTCGRPIAAALAGKPPNKTLSAMVRVKNEEEYLDRAVSSIVDLVEEVVIVDNLSDDATPEVIEALRLKYPAKIRAFSYPHRVARYGDEHTELAKTRAGRRSPSYLPNFYSWCRLRCTHPYILKWDGDTVATEALAPALRTFRQSKSQILFHTGFNLHESREHFISGRPFEDVEPRLFYKPFSRYGDYFGYAEKLVSPYATLFSEYSEHIHEPLYIHLKFCKQQRFTNMSANLQEQEQGFSSRGQELPADLRRQVVALGL
jgi:glycosyltransferase involved in cell wall biosynthesis